MKLLAGVTFDVLSNYHQVDFVELPGVINCCSKYENASGFGFNAGIFGETGIFNFLDFRLGLGYSTQNGDFKSEEFIGYTEVNGELKHVTTTHNLETEISNINISPCFSFLFHSFRLNAGFLSGILVSKNYNQHEDLNPNISENDIEFYDGTNFLGTSRNKSSGKLTDALLYHAITVGLAYDLDITKIFFLRPEVTYLYNLKNIVKTIYWRINSISYGISFGYRLNNPEKELIKLEDIADINQKVKDINYAAQTENKDEKENDVKLVDNQDCCFIIFSSTQDKQKAQVVLDKVKSANLNNDVFMEEWTNPYSNIKYYRVRSGCFANTSIAYDEKNKIQIDDIEAGNVFVIKCN